MSKILVVDADSKAGYPNLAIMKISAWHKKQGDSVDLIKGIPEAPPLFKYDKTYISVIFWQNATRANSYARMLEGKVELGGIGESYAKLPDKIEHIRPDYSLYGIDFSMGYTSRGCFRKCPWCVVPKKEGDIHDNAPISEFWDPAHSKIILLDNNFQASPNWRPNLDFINAHDLKVNFNQGLDIRLMTKEFAQALAQTKYYTWSFKTCSLHFAFDTLKVERAVKRGIKILESAGVPARNLMFYVLVGFDTTIEQDLYRIRLLKDLGALPFVMIYNRDKDRELRHLARWVNRGYYQFVEWSDYKK